VAAEEAGQVVSLVGSDTRVEVGISVGQANVGTRVVVSIGGDMEPVGGGAVQLASATTNTMSMMAARCALTRKGSGELRLTRNERSESISFPPVAHARVAESAL